VFRNGQLKEYLTTGTSKVDFVNRVKAVLGDGSSTEIPTGSTGIPPVAAAEDGEVIQDAVSPESQLEPQSHAVQQVLDERRIRLEAKKKEQDALAKAERASKAAAKKQALEAASASDPKKSADIKYALAQKKRQQEARDERTRILKRVEDDKAERKAKEALRKEQAKVAAELPSQAEAANAGQSSNIHRSAAQCAVQVRLFDGSTIRSRFPSHNSLIKDVRKWIDGQRADGDIPYNFKQVLTPMPNRTISMSEEEQSLQTLGFVPSTTLILVPIKDFTSAYEGGSAGYLSRGLSAGFGLASAGVGLVTGTLGSLLGSSSSSENAPRQESSPAREASPGEHQLYNGNAVSSPVYTSRYQKLQPLTVSQLNFEPRRDNNDKQD
jgi:hypothetical protein